MTGKLRDDCRLGVANNVFATVRICEQALTHISGTSSNHQPVEVLGFGLLRFASVFFRTSLDKPSLSNQQGHFSRQDHTVVYQRNWRLLS